MVICRRHLLPTQSISMVGFFLSLVDCPPHNIVHDIMHCPNYYDPLYYPKYYPELFAMPSSEVMVVLSYLSITEVVHLILCHKNHSERTVFAITGLGKQKLLLRHSWLRNHNPEIDWVKGEVKMSRCPPRCCSGYWDELCLCCPCSSRHHITFWKLNSHQSRNNRSLVLQTWVAYQQYALC